MRLRDAAGRLAEIPVKKRKGLFQLGRDRPEGSVELGADAFDRRDNDDGNAGSDQAVLDSCRGIFIFQKFVDKPHGAFSLKFEGILCSKVLQIVSTARENGFLEGLRSPGGFYL